MGFVCPQIWTYFRLEIFSFAIFLQCKFKRTKFSSNVFSKSCNYADLHINEWRMTGTMTENLSVQFTSLFGTERSRAVKTGPFTRQVSWQIMLMRRKKMKNMEKKIAFVSTLSIIFLFFCCIGFRWFEKCAIIYMWPQSKCWFFLKLRYGGGGFCYL